MTQRTWAALLAVPLFVALGLYTAISALPFVTYAPGLTMNVLGDNGGKPIIQVQGHRTYSDDGQLRMTTVSVTQRDAKLDLFTLMRTWFSSHDAVYPYAIQYGDGGTQQQDVQEGQAEMIGSQDNAIASALRQLGYQVSPVMEIQGITPGLPAEGKLQPRDIIRRFAGTKVNAGTDMVKLIARVPVGKKVPVTVERKGKRVTVHVAPVDVQGNHKIGVALGIGYQLPFKVTVDPGADIGGPSAGLMFALSIYDLLTPGSLTGGAKIAGTGEIDGHGHVGEIGGIQQKIVGARRDGAQLFLVPAANCADALTADRGSMRLAKVSTLRGAITAVTAWTRNQDAALPQCTASDGPGS